MLPGSLRHALAGTPCPVQSSDCKQPCRCSRLQSPLLCCLTAQACASAVLIPGRTLLARYHERWATCSRRSRVRHAMQHRCPVAPRRRTVHSTQALPSSVTPTISTVIYGRCQKFPRVAASAAP
eukprot:357554-Chlamydomonas_euryale.AAC.6